MDIRRKLHLVVYRVREKGLEIFVSHDDQNALQLPEAADHCDEQSLIRLREEIIALGAEDESGAITEGMAIEGDYHDIPSLKGLLLNDARRIGEALSSKDLGNEGRFVAIKELAKTILPSQYKMLKELRDILVDRNSTRYI